MSLWVSSSAKSAGALLSPPPSSYHVASISRMWPPLQGAARKGGMVPAFKDPQRDAWPSGLWTVLKVENDKVKMLQKHPEGKKWSLKE